MSLCTRGRGRRYIRIYIHTHEIPSIPPFSRNTRGIRKRVRERKGKREKITCLIGIRLRLFDYPIKRTTQFLTTKSVFFCLDHASFAQVYSEATGESTDLISNKLVDAALHRIDHCCLKLSRQSEQERQGIYINFRERLKLLDSIREIIISLIHRVYIFAPLSQKFFVRHF